MERDGTTAASSTAFLACSHLLWNQMTLDETLHAVGVTGVPCICIEGFGNGLFRRPYDDSNQHLSQLKSAFQSHLKSHSILHCVATIWERMIVDWVNFQ